MLNKINILHISEDEKFIDMGIKVFEKAYPESNKLILVSNNSEIKHVTFKSKEVLTKKKLAKSSKNSGFWTDVDTVIFHSLFIYNVTIPKGVKVVWVGFGFDYYDYILPNNFAFFGEKTKKIIQEVKSTKEKIKTLIRFKYFEQKQKKQFIERVDVFCPVLACEYQAMKWPTLDRPKFMDWNYGTMEDDWAKDTELCLTGDNILLGNSSTKTCNHIEAIDLINTTDYNGKLILPLSYGDKKYGKLVKSYAQDNYQGDVLALEDFMSFENYMRLISSCSIVIMPHKRQQGLGNIVMLLNLGAKVFLDKDNLLYDYLKEKGFYIFALEDINSSGFKIKLTSMQIAKNKNLLNEIWGRDSILAKTKALIECKLSY